MFDLYVKIFPGLTLSSAIFLMIVGLIQLRLFMKTQYVRSRNIFLFCFLSAGESLNQFITQSRLFSDDFTLLSCHIGVFCLLALNIFYIRSLNFFIAVPDWLCKSFTRIFGLFSLMALASLVFYLLTGQTYYFDGMVSAEGIGNYFTDSYNQRFGFATYWVKVPLGIGGVMSILAALVMLKVVLKTSKDPYFTIGLLLTIICIFRDTLLLPLTIEYYVPFFFVAYLFEAFRMNALAYGEYLQDQVESTLEPMQVSEKYQNSNLSEERIAKLAQRLKDLLVVHRVYLNPNLISDDLAKALGIPSYQVSQVINIGLRTSFFELISFYRIEEVKKRLMAEELNGETIINIAYDSGFNSKSSFNTSFKKITGMTPSAYRKSYKVMAQN